VGEFAAPVLKVRVGSAMPSVGEQAMAEGPITEL